MWGGGNKQKFTKTMSTQTNSRASISVQTQTDTELPAPSNVVETNDQTFDLFSSTFNSTSEVAIISKALETSGVKSSYTVGGAQDSNDQMINLNSSTLNSTPEVSITSKALDGGRGGGGIGQPATVHEACNVVKENDLPNRIENFDGTLPSRDFSKQGDPKDASGKKRQEEEEAVAMEFVANSACPSRLLVQPLEITPECPTKLVIAFNRCNSKIPSSSKAGGLVGSETLLATTQGPAPAINTQDKSNLHAISEATINSNVSSASLTAQQPVRLLSLSFGKARDTPRLHVAPQQPSSITTAATISSCSDSHTKDENDALCSLVLADSSDIDRGINSQVCAFLRNAV